MKRLILLYFLLLLLCAEAQAWMNPYVAGQTVASASKSCPGDATLFLDKIADSGSRDFYQIGYSANTVYVGQGYFDPGANKTVCSAKIDVRSIAGSGNPIDMKVSIFAMSTDDLGSAPSGTCVSSTTSVTGGGLFTFSGLSCSLVNGTTYGVVLHRADNSYDGDNFPTIWVSLSSTYSGGFTWWTSSKTYAGSIGTDTDLSMQLYGFTTP